LANPLTDIVLWYPLVYMVYGLSDPYLHTVIEPDDEID
jgi:hypothetical protein